MPFATPPSNAKARSRVPTSLTIHDEVLHPFASGDFGALYEGALCDKTQRHMVSHKSMPRVMVTKVTKDKASFEAELEMANRLVEYDDEQEYWLYPTAWCIHGSYYMFEMPHGGTSLFLYGEELKRKDKYMSDQEAEHIYNSVIVAVRKLARHGMHHGDIHVRNVMLEPKTDDMPHVRLIDFSSETSVLRDMVMVDSAILGYLLEVTDPDLEFYKEHKKKFQKTFFEVLETPDSSKALQDLTPGKGATPSKKQTEGEWAVSKRGRFSNQQVRLQPTKLNFGSDSPMDDH